MPRFPNLWMTMPVHIADRVLQTDLIMARPNSRAQRHQNWPTQHEKKRGADQFMIDLPNQQACLPNHSALHSSWRAHELRVLTHKPKENDGEHARSIHSSYFHLLHLFIAQLEASKELTIITGIEESEKKKKEEEKNRDRLQELMCLVKPSMNTAKSKRLRESVAGEK